MTISYRYGRSDNFVIVERNDDTGFERWIPADPGNADFQKLIESKIAIEPFVLVPGSRDDPSRLIVDDDDIKAATLEAFQTLADAGVKLGPSMAALLTKIADIKARV